MYYNISYIYIIDHQRLYVVQTLQLFLYLNTTGVLLYFEKNTTVVLLHSYQITAADVVLYSNSCNTTSFYSAHKTLNITASGTHVSVKTSLSMNFIEWLVGFTDGAFSFGKDDGVYAFTFKLSQSAYNIRVLEYIQSKLGCGSITPQDTKKYNYQYRIRDQELLSNIIIPIFDSYPLHSTKAYSYGLFKEALSDVHRLDQLKYLLSIRADYKSPHNDKPTKNWVVGFTEAEGSFFLVHKGNGRYVHCFGITQKLDKHLLEYIKVLFNIQVSRASREAVRVV